MSEYHNDIFYDTRGIDLGEKVALLNMCKDLSSDWRADILTGVRRERVNMAWDEILGKLDDDSHFVFIHRRGYDNWKDQPDCWCIETGFRTMHSPDYFLFIWVPEEHLEDIVKEFKLKILS